MSPAESHAHDTAAQSSTSAVGTAVLAVGLALVTGAALPQSWGLVPALVVATVAMAVARRRIVRRGAVGWSALMQARARALGPALLGTTAFVAIVICSVCAQGVGALAVAQPGIVPALALVFVAVLALPRAKSSPRATAVVLGLAVPVVAMLGAGFEAEGPDARGEMHSGPIHGIHPFQTTAVVVDGHGPYDLPINDYVEPAGGRGYDPVAFADAIERALHRIAVVHYEHGPERARVAFADATAGAVTTGPVLERLDRAPTETEHPRFWVRSGTTGQRSRVEFVCPGRRDDPRPPPPENPTNRMCPDKYANEASAGLGVTGRWPGYVELRGNERMGFSRLLGATRSDDDEGRTLVRREIIAWAWIVLVLALVVAGRRARAEAVTDPSIDRGVLGVLGLTLAIGLALAVVIAGIGASDLGTLDAFTRAPAWRSAWHLPDWIAAIAWPAAAGVALWSYDAAPIGAGRRQGWLVLALVVLAVVATDLDALHWAMPDVGGSPSALPFEAFVLGLADRVHAVVPLDILQLEAIVAALAAGVLVLACTFVLGVVARAAHAIRPAAAEPGTRWRMGALVACAGLAMALVVSRKTEGGAALIPVAVGAALVLGSTLDEIRRRGPAPSGVPAVRALGLVGWIALGLLLALQADPLGTGGDLLRAVYGVLGLLAVVLPVVVLVPDPRVPPVPPGGASPHPGSA